ncbi:MAG: DUF2207 domain-containing protein [Tissierellia bacterium]|nr:DUF2207 domain-containing protein [Tissierellia bacterium]
MSFLLSNPSSPSIFTRIQSKIHMPSSEFLWLGLGLVSLLVFVWAYLRNRQDSPSPSHLSPEVLALSPGEAGFFLEGYKHPEAIILASLLDFSRRGLVDLEDLLGEPRLYFKDQKAHLLAHEKYLLDWIKGLGQGDEVAFKTLRHQRLGNPDSFNKALYQWFDLLDQSLKERGLKGDRTYKKERAPGILLLGGGFLVLSGLGLASGAYTALLMLFSSLAFFVLAARIYGRLPQRGQAVLNYLRPLEKESQEDLYGALNRLEADRVLLFALALNRPLEDLVSPASPLSEALYKKDKALDKEAKKALKATFIGQLSL